MTDESNIAPFRRLLNAAAPYDPAEDESPASVAGSPRKPIGGATPGSDKAELHRLGHAIRFLWTSGKLAIAEYENWRNIGFALKPFGEPGWEKFLAISADDPSFGSEEECRRLWDGIKDNRPEGQRITGATFFKAALEAGWQDPTREADEGPAGGGGSKGKPDAASVVLEQADEACDEHFLDKDGVAYARFRRKTDDDTSARVVARIDSERYQDVLRLRFFREAGNKTLAKEQLANALALMRATAVEANDRREVFLRVGGCNGRVYIDLSGDGSLVYEVDGAGWRRADDPPVLFVAGSRGALPEPIAGGTIADLKSHMPNLDLPSVQRVLAFVIGAFRLHGTHAMMVFGGQHGNNKSTMADMTVALCDPPTAWQGARYSFSADDRDLVIHAAGAYVLNFDNVSTFGPRESDRLCKLTSGIAFATRKLHTNREEERFAVRRPVIATCIGTPTTRGDLLDRTMPILAEAGGQQRTEEEVWEAFAADWPKLFGLVLTGVSHAIRNKDRVREKVSAGTIAPPRLRDFALFVEGANEVLGLAPGAFCTMLRDEQGGMQAEAAAADPLGAALVHYFSLTGAKPIDTTAIELLTILADGSRERERGWPSKFRFNDHMQRITPGLRDLGISVKATKPAGKANVMRYQISATTSFRKIDLTGGLPF